MSKFEGSLAGKDLITYAPRGDKRYSSNDIGNYLGRFKLCDALRFIGELSHKIFISGQGSIFIQGIPVSDSVLAYLSMRLIEKSNDHRHQNMTQDDLLTAIDMYFGLPDPLEKNSDNAQGCLIRFGHYQFDYDRELRHLLPRTLIIYRDLWNTVTNNRQVDVDSAIYQFTGLTLQEILLLSVFFSGKSQKGFFRLDQSIDNYPDTAKSYFDIDKQKAFVDWLSCSYSEFREQSKNKKYLPPEIEYEKFRFNYLHTKPIIIPKRNPQPTFPQVYITPIPTLIYECVTRGLFFSLAEHFRSEKGNRFRGAFGDVFEQYVGLLLKKTFGEENVQCAWKYGSKSHRKDTPDWYVIQNGLVVLIEVKHSGLYLDAKQWGNLEDIQKNLKNTIGAGVHQMWELEEDIESGLCTTPDWFTNLKITERLVITYDRSYFLNYILRDEIRQLYSSIPATYHWHTIAVEELEYFLGIVGTDFIEALTEKRLDPDSDRMDFRDYYSRKYPHGNFNNPYLDSVYDKYFSDLGFLDNKLL